MYNQLDKGRTAIARATEEWKGIFIMLESRFSALKPQLLYTAIVTGSNTVIPEWKTVTEEIPGTGEFILYRYTLQSLPENETGFEVSVAGIRRVGFERFITETIKKETFLPGNYYKMPSGTKYEAR